MLVATPSAMLCIGKTISFPDFQDSYTAGADEACTPTTLTLGLIDFATIAVDAAPLPPPTGTIMTSTSGKSSRISKVYVPTPAYKTMFFTE